MGTLASEDSLIWVPVSESCLIWVPVSDPFLTCLPVSEPFLICLPVSEPFLISLPVSYWFFTFALVMISLLAAVAVPPIATNKAMSAITMLADGRLANLVRMRSPPSLEPDRLQGGATLSANRPPVNGPKTPRRAGRRARVVRLRYCLITSRRPRLWRNW